VRYSVSHIWPPVIWAGFIFALSSIPGDQLPTPWAWTPDKLIHTIIFGVLAYLTLRFFIHAGTRQNKSIAWVLTAGIICSVLYAASDELHQLVVPNRSCELGDFVADTVGIMAVGIYYYVRRGRHVVV